jgi:hypothetical protein
VAPVAELGRGEQGLLGAGVQRFAAHDQPGAVRPVAEVDQRPRLPGRPSHVPSRPGERPRRSPGHPRCPRPARGLARRITTLRVPPVGMAVDLRRHRPRGERGQVPVTDPRCRPVAPRYGAQLARSSGCLPPACRIATRGIRWSRLSRTPGPPRLETGCMRCLGVVR